MKAKKTRRNFGAEHPASLRAIFSQITDMAQTTAYFQKHNKYFAACVFYIFIYIITSIYSMSTWNQRKFPDFSLVFRKIMFDKSGESRYNSKVRLRGGKKYAAGTWKDH
ncbi:MAG: hypothetical protein E7453_06500 [Ruminococcaceae bacterium]|nr:hypothetical protein [Oscillospiraceae bacterium]